MEPILGTFHDALTGETITRELTAEEIEAPVTEIGTPEEIVVLPELAPTLGDY
jgi:hypothetical protein